MVEKHFFSLSDVYSACESFYFNCLELCGSLFSLVFRRFNQRIVQFLSPADICERDKSQKIVNNEKMQCKYRDEFVIKLMTISSSIFSFFSRHEKLLKMKKNDILFSSKQ